MAKTREKKGGDADNEGSTLSHAAKRTHSVTYKNVFFQN